MVAQPRRGVQQLCVGGHGEPVAVPGAVDPEPQPDRIDFVSHYAAPRPVSGAASCTRSATTIFRWLNHFSTRAALPRPRAWKRRIATDFPTSARDTTRRSTSRE